MKQHYTFLGMMILCVLLVPLTVMAQSISTAAEVVVGDDNQDRSNPLDDDGAVVVSLGQSFSFTNNGQTDLQLVINPAQDITLLDTKYTLRTDLPFSDRTTIENLLENDEDLLVVEVDTTTITVPVGLSANFDFETMIPASLDAVDANFRESSFDVMRFHFDVQDLQGNSVETVIVRVLMQAVNQLRIEDLDAEINSRDRQSIDEGDEIDDLKPGDRVDLEVEVENRFSNDDDVDIEDVDLEIDCDNNNDIDFDDETEDLGDLGADDKELQTLTFDIEEDAEDDSIKCDVFVNGEDENGARHGDIIDFDLDIVRKSHDINIRNILVTPTQLACDDNNIQLTVDILNLGRSDEDDIAIKVESKTLNIAERLSGIQDLDEDDSLSESFTFPIEPRELAAGSYALQIQTFYDNVKLSDTEIVTLDNTCNAIVRDDDSDDDGDEPRVIGDNVLSLQQGTVEAAAGDSASIEILLSNTERTAVDYIITLENLEEFAEGTSTKTVHLNPGQSSTVFMNVKVRDDIENGKYTATVKVKNENSGTTVQAETFTVDVSGESSAASADAGFDFDFTGEGSKPVLILVNIILVIIAIFFIKLIFTPGKKQKPAVKAQDKMKLADFEPVKKRK